MELDGGTVLHGAVAHQNGWIAVAIKPAYALAKFKGGAMESNGKPIRLGQLIKIGRNQAIQIPIGFELSGTTATRRREGSRLILEPLSRPSLQGLFASWDALPEGLSPFENLPTDAVKL